MPLLWCSISGHGFGHAAQVTPVLNELGARLPGLRAILRTTVPASFFEARLTIPWTLSPARQDIGCIQHGPLVIDIEATWKAHLTFHDDWDRLIEMERREMASAAPDLVLSDISHLSIDAAARSGFRPIALSSLSWDAILQGYLSPSSPVVAEQHAAIAHIRRCYEAAEVLIRPAPGMDLPAFKSIADVGPIVEPITPESARLRDAIGAGWEERLVLVGFGGISLTDLPYERMEQTAGCRFFIDGRPPRSFQRIHSALDLGMTFMTVLASVDMIITKPGYSTIVEAVDKRKPVIYVRRHHFGDEASLVEYLHRYGRGAELSLGDFSSGQWESALDAAWHAPQPADQPPASGVAQAADLLAPFLV
ncbi:MAG TPA: hypothetical protein VLA99_16315 [Nitrospiraceae bacterium]|nr:hypothetical protein [Nitrospiraceae bacterium]